MGKSRMTTLILSPDTAPLLAAVRAVLDTEDLPTAALIGGLAVTIRVAAPATTYRATADIDIVTTDTDPTLVEILATRHHTTEPLHIAGIKVDVIPTHPVTVADLDGIDGIDDGPRLFVAAHRWALVTAEPLTLATSTSEPFTVDVATPAALLATKCHAVGYARSQRRATKHGGDMLDVYRLIDAHDRDGELAAKIHEAPGDLAPVIARVIGTEILANPAKAAGSMTSASPTPIDPDDLVASLEAFIEDLRG
jgi:hypothetical protein